MGYTTEFSGSVKIEPPLNEEEIAFLNKFSDTRRMNRRKGPYYVDNAGMAGQDREPDIIDYNSLTRASPVCGVSGFLPKMVVLLNGMDARSSMTLRSGWNISLNIS